MHSVSSRPLGRVLVASVTAVAFESSIRSRTLCQASLGRAFRRGCDTNAKPEDTDLRIPDPRTPTTHENTTREHTTRRR
ncbi:hypothetical protein H5410_017742 [Solanum commersonii]|uniref:Uncharacterized protein n=1 Tax=Solanum commersonii TaxID=4109 RepID=A0A9J5ZZY3_SOLCO|nr:hypothetical protein H5410_017742 [Solanum commersonii]